MPDFSASAELFVHFLIYAYSESLMAQYLSVMRARCLVMKSVSAFPVIVLCQVMWFYNANITVSDFPERLSRNIVQTGCHNFT